MITLARQVQLKLKKFDEVMIKLKTKYLNNPTLYSELHKLDERKEEIQKLVDIQQLNIVLCTLINQ